MFCIRKGPNEYLDTKIRHVGSRLRANDSGGLGDSGYFGGSLLMVFLFCDCHLDGDSGPGGNSLPSDTTNSNSSL